MPLAWRMNLAAAQCSYIRSKTAGAAVFEQDRDALAVATSAPAHERGDGKREETSPSQTPPARCREPHLGHNCVPGKGQRHEGADQDQFMGGGAMDGAEPRYPASATVLKAILTEVVQHPMLRDRLILD